MFSFYCASGPRHGPIQPESTGTRTAPPARTESRVSLKSATSPSVTEGNRSYACRIRRAMRIRVAWHRSIANHSRDLPRVDCKHRHPGNYDCRRVSDDGRASGTIFGCSACAAVLVVCSDARGLPKGVERRANQQSGTLRRFEQAPTSPCFQRRIPPCFNHYCGHCPGVRTAMIQS